ncbi:HK97-gp10 family putative phage morphogenesis protein [Enterocloster alcoholdehydrogenati]|uniref:HK97-gp10 family putative phage morphogenesis protein n=1 Tax=Enterocloster alcoholdehydrogenati TaxID=2547410 RepID=UPI001593ABBA|nr:HK97-gp10 family putative phage morphogenesis protein [Enterocloster alcoholdehydrogenati]
MPKGIQGLDALMRKYGELAGHVAAEAMPRAVGAAAKLVRAEAALRCPVHDGELRSSIRTMVSQDADGATGTIYTNKAYAGYVEFGTGPKGEANHAGISPEVTPVYTQSPWWIHESMIDREIAETYHWFFIDTPEGRFYQCTGQPAQPFLYPALKNNEERVTRNISNYISREIKKVIT